MIISAGCCFIIAHVKMSIDTCVAITITTTMTITTTRSTTTTITHICPGLNANEIQIPHDKHHKVSSLVKCYQNTHSSVKYEVI